MGLQDLLHNGAPLRHRVQRQPVDLVVHPAGMGMDPSSGNLVWVPTADLVGTQDVTLRIQDGRGGVALQSFQITVSRPNSTPGRT